MSTIQNKTSLNTICYHCGDQCRNERIQLDEKLFCCHGCKTVYEILNENNLCNYYSMNETPGLDQKVEIRKDKYAFLDQKDIQRKLIQFSSGSKSQITFYLPQMHCSSCLWLLENISKINSGIIDSRVNFSTKELLVSFNHEETTLRSVVETLAKVGYEPHLSLSEIESKDLHQIDRTRWYKLGVAGFCFGNIMMMSLAEYFAIDNSIEHSIHLFFQIASIVLALPVLFYAASEFFVSAYHGVINKYLNIDFPVALALVITFTRSLYEIFNGMGNGYLDSMSGIVFFMLIGRWLQSRTYQSLTFDRDYKSFFPIAINVLKDKTIVATEIQAIKKNDIVQIHHNEIIPLDTMLSKGIAKIDYSFVTGESEPVNVAVGELIYAGGKQMGGLLELVVVKEASQSYLTQLWNNPIFNKEEKKESNIYDYIGKYFTYLVLLIGGIAGLFWYTQQQYDLMWNAMTTVLIVACPCALLLSHNFTNGNIIRIFAQNKFYLKSAEVLDKITKINHIVFDKTGTLTQANSSKVQYNGIEMDDSTKLIVASLARQSSHINSQLIHDYLNVGKAIEIDHFKELEGLGIEGWVEEKHIKLGSEKFIGGAYTNVRNQSKVVVYIDGIIVGEFNFSNRYRMGISNLLSGLKNKFTVSLLSGDNDGEMDHMKNLMGDESNIHFNQNPQQKLDYIKSLQEVNHSKVMMIGDGLNDAGAFKQSDVGIAIADSKNSFTPNSDGIIEASRLIWLGKYIHFAHIGKSIIFISFGVSAIYNFIGLYFAVRGVLSPVIAAILMPASSISIILMTYGITDLMARKYNLKK